MYIIKSKKELSAFIKNQTITFKKTSIGFVPTMGALHKGHIELINKSNQENDITVVSIFVNKIQFNDVNDFLNYPKTIFDDIDLLIKHKTNVLFYPEDADIYDSDFVLEKYNIGEIENIFEGIVRPNHFQGVCVIMYELLRIVLPTALYLGQKDYQQYLVVKKLIELKKINVELKICKTVRDENNLAYSSRLVRLSTSEKIMAYNIYKCLLEIKNDHNNFAQLKIKWTNFFQNENHITVDYLEIVNADNLEICCDEKIKIIALVALKFTTVRLIDNLPINFEIQ